MSNLISIIKQLQYNYSFCIGQQSAWHSHLYLHCARVHFNWAKTLVLRWIQLCFIDLHQSSIAVPTSLNEPDSLATQTMIGLVRINRAGVNTSLITMLWSPCLKNYFRNEQVHYICQTLYCKMEWHQTGFRKMCCGTKRNHRLCLMDFQSLNWPIEQA